MTRLILKTMLSEARLRGGEKDAVAVQTLELEDVDPL